MDNPSLAKPSSKKPVPPYLSWKTFSGYIKSLSQGIPDPIDTSGMINLSGSNRALAMSALRYLNLVNADKHPTEDLKPLVDAMTKSNDVQYQMLLRDLLEKAYPFLFGNGFDLSTSTPAAFSQKFKETGLGGETVRKGEAFFLEAAKDAEITISPYILGSRKKGPKAGSTSVVSRQRTKAGSKKIKGGEGQIETVENTDLRTIMLDTLASKFPQFDPNWSNEAQEAWFEMYGRLLNIVENDDQAEQE